MLPSTECKVFLPKYDNIQIETEIKETKRQGQIEIAIEKEKKQKKGRERERGGGKRVLSNREYTPSNCIQEYTFIIQQNYKQLIHNTSTYERQFMERK